MNFDSGLDLTNLELTVVYFDRVEISRPTPGWPDCCGRSVS